MQSRDKLHSRNYLGRIDPNLWKYNSCHLMLQSYTADHPGPTEFLQRVMIMEGTASGLFM